MFDLLCITSLRRFCLSVKGVSTWIIGLESQRWLRCLGLVNRSCIWFTGRRWGWLERKYRKKTQSPFLYFCKFYQKCIWNYPTFLQITVELRNLFCGGFGVIRPQMGCSFSVTFHWSGHITWVQMQRVEFRKRFCGPLLIFISGFQLENWSSNSIITRKYWHWIVKQKATTKTTKESQQNKTNKKQVETKSASFRSQHGKSFLEEKACHSEKALKKQPRSHEWLILTSLHCCHLDFHLLQTQRKGRSYWPPSSHLHAEDSLWSPALDLWPETTPPLSLCLSSRSVNQRVGQDHFQGLCML